MKYALVLIPLSDERDLNDLQVDYQVLTKDGDDYFESCVAEDTAVPLIPLPDKITDFIECEYEYDEYEVYEEISENGIRMGWNKCLEHILKEYENVLMKY